MTELDPDTSRVRALNRLSVEELFGRYTYEIPVDAGQLDPQLSILYGENGAGKTTILKLLHNIVSTEARRNHKTEIAQVPFKSFTAHFSGGIALKASRNKAQPGTFTMELRSPKRRPSEVIFTAVDGVIPQRGPHSEAQDRFLNTVKSILDINSYFLADERILESDQFVDEEELLADEYVQVVDEYSRRILRTPRHRIRETQRDQQLELALKRALQWLRPQVLTGANVGSVNANSVYADVVKRISIEPDDKDLHTNLARVSIIDEAMTLGKRATAQARFGLTPALQMNELLDALRHTSPDRRSLVIRLLQPYLDTLKARLDAMEDLHRVLESFTDSLNSFLIDKVISFDVRRGIVVRTRDRNSLPPERLSSGEKQLLMLFCNLLVSRQNPSLFLIDEPELSLNIKWQRKLIPALLELTADSQIQLIMATHSIELLSTYTDRVVRLPFGPE